MTSNIWIENVLRRIPSFLGVYSSDNIPPPKFFPSSCIVNFSSYHDIGTHFITLLYDNPYCCRYFDPLDLNFIPQNISEFLKTHFPNKYRIIHFKIQHSLSNFCGIYCMCVCILHNNKRSVLETLKNNFFEDELANDKKVVHLVCKLIQNTPF